MALGAHMHPYSYMYCAPHQDGVLHVAAVRNMALQHHEFELRLRDAKRLRLYVQAGMAEWEMQSASLKKAELACRRLELEVKESVERAT